jgi:hypothetical protein
MTDETEQAVDDAASPIDWGMSAALESVPRGGSELAEVTSLEGAVREWLDLDEEHRAEAVLTLDRPLVLDGVSRMDLEGDEIGALADRLPANG